MLDKRNSVMRLEEIEEYKIDSEKEKAIKELLQKSFELYPNDRIFYKQVPSFRLLLWADDILAAQIGIVFRVVSLDKNPIRIFGLMDLCVDENYRSKKIGSKVLKNIEKIGKKNQIDFLLLFGGIQDYYEQKGFQMVTNSCRWVLMKDYETLGILNRKIPDTLLIKSLSNKKWNEKSDLDLMGFVF
jgi:predicted N-acetyltransferase YhbS